MPRPQLILVTPLLKLADKVATFEDKLRSWEMRINQRVFDMFQTLAKTLKGSELEQEFFDLVTSHLRALPKEFKRYFQSAKDPRAAKKWIRNPFNFKPGEGNLPVRQEDQLLNTANDGNLKHLFETMT